MVRLLWPLAYFATLVLRADAWEHVSPDALESALRDHDVTVVAFVKPSEEKSKALEVEWKLAAPEAQVPFISVDCASHPDTCKQHGVSSPDPSVKLFGKGDVKSTYQGPRRASAILAWLARAQRPTVTPIHDAESLAALKSADETVFIAFLGPDSAEDSSSAAFRDIAARFGDEFTFGLVLDADLLAVEGLEASTAAVKCYRPLDGDTRVFKGSVADVGAVEMFVREASRPIIGELLPHNRKRFLERGWPMVYIFGATEAQRTELRAFLSKLARGQYESLTMVTVDPLEFPDLQAELGLEPGVFPSGAVHQLSTNHIYHYPRGQPVTSGALQKWGLDVWQGRVRPWNSGRGGDGDRDGNETPLGRIQATGKVSMRKFPGMKINIGRDEL